MFPVTDQSYHSATLLGGSEFTIAQTLINKDLAWELIMLILDPKIMVPFHIKYAPLPTQVSIGNGPYTA